MYVATLLDEFDARSVGMPMPPVLSKMLDTYAYLMAKNKLKVLPLRIFTDHHVDLESGSKPMAKAPYTLLGPNLKELNC